MDEIVRSTFLSTIKFLPSEFMVMPLSRWNESVLRYYFCRFLAVEHPEVEQFVECSRIDLVLRRLPLVAFIEFKYFARPPRFDPYDATARGFKGGPGQPNLAEFQKCIDQLHTRRSTTGLSKYVILVYADSVGGRRPRLNYSDHYDQYRHPRGDVALRLAESSESIDTSEGMVRAQLYEVG